MEIIVESTVGMSVLLKSFDKMGNIWGSNLITCKDGNMFKASNPGISYQYLIKNKHWLS